MKLSGWHIKNNMLRIVEILDVKTENPFVKTLFFKDEICRLAEPGQFVMVWIPGVDEIPLSISFTRPDGSSSVTVAEVGEATRALTRLRVGDLVGVRGPFGSSFRAAGGRALIIGGGTGMVPLMMLIDKLARKNIEATVIEGAENSSKLVFLEELRNMVRDYGIKVFFTTEDGSYGVRGLATDLAESLLRREKFDVIYVCGPEKMIRKVYDFAKAHSVDLQASLERYMRCAVGICGSCTIGKYRVCTDGPVFDMAKLREVEEYLGAFKYNERGEKVPV
ncbi:MAG: dihydroorotate dehydrogenase electron transfer subunit [Candidatus Bathyarchaeota archaeon]|nr:dihydroorotate dehydrogenase electron transfer subunit [Candidatus Bathyarchaeota archaeon]